MGAFADNLTGVVDAPPTIQNNTEVYQWQCPAGVTSVSVLVIGGGGAGGDKNGGGGGGGALAYGNSIAVRPGTIYYVGAGLGGKNVTTLGVTTINPQSKNTLYNFGGDSYFISPAVLNAGGGKEGLAGGNSSNTAGGGGGAGGYSGPGGNGGSVPTTLSIKITKYSGGAGGTHSGTYLTGGGAGGKGGTSCASNQNTDAGTAGTGGASGGGGGGSIAFGGGGTGISGTGTAGVGGSATTATTIGASASKVLNGGSKLIIPYGSLITGSPAGYDNNTIPSRPGVPITQTITPSVGQTVTYTDPFLSLPLCGGVDTTSPEGGMYGGGGTGSGSGIYSGGRGVVRIIWGTNRSFPSTNVTDQPITTSTGQITYIAQVGPVPWPNFPVAYNANVTVYKNTTDNVISVTYDNPSNLTANLYVTSKSVSVPAGTASGTALMFSNTSIKYTPTTNFLGTTNFTYLIQNSYGNSFPALVTVNVVEPNLFKSIVLNNIVDWNYKITNKIINDNKTTVTVTNPTNQTLVFTNTDGFLNRFGSSSTSMTATLNWNTFFNYVKTNNLTIDYYTGVSVTSTFTVSYTNYIAVVSVRINVVTLPPPGELLSFTCVTRPGAPLGTYADGKGGTYTQTVPGGDNFCKPSWDPCLKYQYINTNAVGFDTTFTGFDVQTGDVIDCYVNQLYEYFTYSPAYVNYYFYVAPTFTVVGDKSNIMIGSGTIPINNGWDPRYYNSGFTPGGPGGWATLTVTVPAGYVGQYLNIWIESTDTNKTIISSFTFKKIIS